MIFIVNRREREPNRDRKERCAYLMCVFPGNQFFAQIFVFIPSQGLKTTPGRGCGITPVVFSKSRMKSCIYHMEFLASGMQKGHAVHLLPLQQGDLVGFCLFFPLKLFSSHLWDPHAPEESFIILSYISILARIITGFITARMSKEESYECRLIKFAAKSQACYLSPGANYLITDIC